MSDALTTTDKPGDPADKAADGAFGGVHSHRAGYGDDKLQRVVNWLRDHPTATLASGEGGLLLAEIDRLHLANKDAIDHYADARAEIDRLHAAIARVRALHTTAANSKYIVCDACSDILPCPTIRTLDGEP